MFRMLPVMLLAIVLTGCASAPLINKESTKDTVLLVGLDLQGSTPSQLGHYYLLNLVDAAENDVQVIVRPRRTDRYMVVTELPPGDYQMVSWAARTAPGVSGFADVSLRAREVDIRFSLEEGAAHKLSQQFNVEHSQDRYGRRIMQASFGPLQDNVAGRMDRRMDQIGPDWVVINEPVGVVPEKEETPARRGGLMQFLFGS